MLVICNSNVRAGHINMWLTVFRHCINHSLLKASYSPSKPFITHFTVSDVAQGLAFILVIQSVGTE